MGLISLEEQAREICLSNRSFIPTTIGLKTWRERLRFDQKTPAQDQSVKIVKERVEIDEERSFDEYLYFPKDQAKNLRVIYYIHGGQFISGGVNEYHKLLAELSRRCHACVVFPEYALAPERKAPAQMVQLRAGYLDLQRLAIKYSLDLSHLTVAGDDVGGGMAATLAMLSEARHLPLKKLLLFYPVVNANFDNPTYYEFAGGYRITREQMKWAWQQYLGELSPTDVMYSPLLRKFSELAVLPKTLILTAEADVLRNEGEAFGRKLRDADVDVSVARILGTIHDFVLLNALDETNACRLAMDMAVEFIGRDSGV